MFRIGTKTFAALLWALLAFGCSNDDDDAPVGVDDDDDDDVVGCELECDAPLVLNEAACLCESAGCDRSCGEDQRLDEAECACVDLPLTHDEPWSFWDEDSACSPGPIECNAANPCEGGEECRAYRCVDPENAPYPHEGESIGVVTGYQIPQLYGEEGCCGDFDGDGENDNALFDLWMELKPQIDANWPELGLESIQRMLNASIEQNLNQILFVAEGAPEGDCGPLPLVAWPANGDLDGDGRLDAALGDLRSGDGTFGVPPQFIGRGIQNEFRGALDEETLRAEAGALVLSLLANTDSTLTPGGDRIDFHLADVRIEGSVDLIDGGIQSLDLPLTNGALGKVSQAVENGDGEDSVGGIRLSGLLLLAPLADQVNARAESCKCAEGETGLGHPVVEHRIEEGAFHLNCDDELSAASEKCGLTRDGFGCVALGDICLALQLMAAAADQSSGATGEDGTTANDAISFGVRVKIAKGEIAPPDDGEVELLGANDDWYRIAANAGATRLTVLENDFDLLLGVPTISEAGEAGHGTVRVVQYRTAIRYRPDEGYEGEDSFTYTISHEVDGETIEKTAAVEVEVIACGDGTYEPERGEECDDELDYNCRQCRCGFDLLPLGNGSCSSPLCGNGALEKGEHCDDGDANGTTPCGCQPDCRLGLVETVCREAETECDEVERCDGETPECPADLNKADGEACDNGTNEPDADVCLAGVCVDQKAECGNGVVEAGEDCDPAETDPTSCCGPTCRFKLNFEACRDTAGPCDVTEYCTGSSAECPADLFVDSTQLCRASDGECDLDEYCTGSSAECPTDISQPAWTPCNSCAAGPGLCDGCDGGICW